MVCKKEKIRSADWRIIYRVSHSLHHMTFILILEVVTKKEFMRILIGKAFGSKNSIHEEEILDIGYIGHCILS